MNKEEKEENSEIHICIFYRGKISDVTLRNNIIYCRRCGGKLKNSQVNPKVLKEIKNEQRRN